MNSSTPVLKIVGAGFVNLLVTLLSAILVFALPFFIDSEPTDFGLGIISIIAFAVAIWLGQQLVIWWSNRASIRGWSLITLLAYGGLFSLVGALVSLPPPSLFNPETNSLVVIIFGTTLLTVLFTIPALLQWIVLNSAVHQAWWWLIVNLLAWSIFWITFGTLAELNASDATLSAAALLSLCATFWVMGAGLAWVVGFPQKGKAKQKRSFVEVA